MQNVVMEVPALQAAPGITPTLPADMDVDDESFALMDAHETPQEKVDADFFNGASRVPAHPAPRASHTPERTRVHRGAQTSRTTSMTKTSAE